MTRNECLCRALALSAAAAVFPASASASLTLLSGSQQGTHAGNLVTNGSFEVGAPAPNVGAFYWAAGTTSTPFGTPGGWSSAGGASNYALWYSMGTGPYQTNFSDDLPDGVSGMYFGNATTSASAAPSWQANGTVTFGSAPVFNPLYGQPTRLWQTVPTNTNIAPAYILSFWASGEDAQSNMWTDGLFGLRVSNVLPGDPIQYLTAPGGQGALGKSIRYEYQFTPLNPLLPVTVEFINWGHLTSWPGAAANTFTTELVLDDVIVNTAPEPGVLGIGLGLGLVAAGRRRH